jgi:hypothetical protein
MGNCELLVLLQIAALPAGMLIGTAWHFIEEHHKK